MVEWPLVRMRAMFPPPPAERPNLSSRCQGRDGPVNRCGRGGGASPLEPGAIPGRHISSLRLLKTASTSWGEVMTPGPGSSAQPHATDQELLQRAQSRAPRLNPWEAHFVRSISGRIYCGYALSGKQSELHRRNSIAVLLEEKKWT